MKKALIMGAGGQLGSYLSEVLLEEGYAVTGAVREYHSKLHIVPGVVYGSPLSLAPFDEIYCLHIARPHFGENLTLSAMLERGLNSVARVLEGARPDCRVLVAGSILQDEGTSPWHLDKQLTERLVMAYPNARMPRLHQYVSERGPIKTMYLMQILHQIARGEVPTPTNPSAEVEVAHARQGARRLYETLQGGDVSRERFETEALSVEEFVERAQTPGHWLADVVEELRG